MNPVLTDDDIAAARAGGASAPPLPAEALGEVTRIIIIGPLYRDAAQQHGPAAA
jgi:hypothetical protein